MTQIRYIGLDGEMTGSGSRDRKRIAFKEYQLIQIGLAVEPNVRFVSDVGYDKWISQPEAMKVNKFTTQRIYDAPRPAQVDEAACRFIDAWVGPSKRDLHAVGWNVGSFDMPFVREYLPALGDRFSYRSVDLNSILYSVVDTDDEYKELKGKAKSGAEVALHNVGIEPKWHDAGYDAAAALMAFKLLREKILPEEFA